MNSNGQTAAHEGTLQVTPTQKRVARIRSEVVIDAPPAAVWDVLVDFAGHASWDPFLVKIDGVATVGSRLRVKFNNGMTLKPTLTEVAQGRELEWVGKLLVAGVFDARHRFELYPEGEKTRLVQSEQFSGLMLPLLKGTLRKTERDFRALNLALKARVEGGPTSPAAQPAS